MKNYKLLPYNKIMKEVDKIEQDIIANNLSNDSCCKDINNCFDNNIINYNLIVYYKYKYWLLVFNNNKILRPYFLRDFIPNLD